MATPALVERLENVAARLERVASRMGGGGGGGGGDDGGDNPPYVQDYQALINQHLGKLEAALTSMNVNGEAIAKYKAAWNNSVRIVQASAQCKRPTNAELAPLVAEGSEAVGFLDNFKHRSRDGPSAVLFDSAQAFNWPIMRAETGFSPSAWLENQAGSAVFNMDKNKMKRNKKFEGDAQHGAEYALCQGLQDFHKAVQDFIKENKFGGSISWNPKGKAVGEFSGGASAATTVDEQKESGPAKKAAAKPAAKAGGGGAVDLKAALAAVTDGESAAKLKKTAKRDKTKKVGGLVKSKAVAKEPKQGTSAARGNMWMVEKWEYTDVVTIDKARMNQTVFISDCVQTAFEITGKVNSVQINNCKKCRIFTNEIISQIELVRCDGVQLVVRKKTPSVNVEKSDACRISITGEAVQEPPRVYSSMVSALCMDLPPKTATSDPIEMAVPEQFLTTIDPVAGTCTTVHVEHSG